MGPIGPPKKIGKNCRCFAFFLPMEKLAPNGARRIFPTNQDLADILGNTDFDFENFCFLDFLVPKFPGSRFPQNLAWARLVPGLGLGPGWAPRLGRMSPWAGPERPSAWAEEPSGGPGGPLGGPSTWSCFICSSARIAPLLEAISDMENSGI